MQVIDLTHIMETGMPVFPGSPKATIKKMSGMEANGYDETYLQFSAHTGTHIDCGRHFYKSGFDTGTSSPENFYGFGLVVNCQGLLNPRLISKPYLQTYDDKLKRADFIIFHTGWSRFWGMADYFRGFPALDQEAAHYLTGFHLKGAGIDAISFDAMESEDFPVHKSLLSVGIALIENLTNLENLPAEGFIFCCFPLRIKEGDGSPVRAVGITF
jgi:arylformamidase